MRALLAVAIVVGATACGPALVDPTAPGALAGALPATFVVDDPVEGAVRAAPVRVWVAPQVRAEPGWRARLTEELDAASQLLVPLCGVRLELVEVREWPLGDGAQVGDGLADLGRRDPGDDVAWVIGVVAPPEVPRGAMAELVAGEPLTRHVVMRGYPAAAEATDLFARLPPRAAAEEAELAGAHRRHKQAAVLLHGLARTLGAIDEREPTTLQHPRYDAGQATFTQRNRALIRRTMAARLGDQPVAQVATELLAMIEGEPWGGWIDGDRDDRVRLLRAVLAAAAAEAVVGGVPAPASAQYERARGLAARGEAAAALAEVEPLLAAYPATAALHVLVCELELGMAGAAPAAVPAACTRARDLAPADPIVFVLLARAAVAHGDPLAAHASVQRAADVLTTRATPPPAAAWGPLVAVYRDLGALSWSEDLLTRAALVDEDTRGWIAQTRARFGAPRGAAPEAEEGALVAAVKAALDLINAKQYPAAAAALDAAATRWPTAPGVPTMRCELALRRDQLAAARRACEAAVAAAPGTSWAQYLLGILRLRGTRAADATAGVAHLRAAIAADPALAQAWRALAKALVRVGDQAGLTALRADHLARFGRAL